MKTNATSRDTDSADDALLAAKKQMRGEMRTRIETIRPFARARRAAALCATVLRAPPMAGAGVVLAYRAMHDEIDVDPIVRALAARGTRIVFPRIDDKGRLLLLESVAGGDPFADDGWTRDRFGIRAPKSERGLTRRVHPRELDALLVPGRAFDARGARLGRGKGFYDGLIRRLRPDTRRATIGVCFGEQLVDCVPEAPHDARVAFVAAGGRLVRARRGDAGGRSADGVSV
ncbi:MAG: 5-formyltetrahydrofolate cyclo-ligase [Phycisphaerales bacterium]|jgi:5-formyltetrahydrofolate cyclo-ligase